MPCAPPVTIAVLFSSLIWCVSCPRAHSSPAMLSEVPVFVVPLERDRVGILAGFLGQGDLLPVQRIVVPAVLDLFLDPPTDFEAQVRRNGHVSSVEPAVDVTSQQQAVTGFMLATVCIGADMRRLQRGQGPLLRHGAPTP